MISIAGRASAALGPLRDSTISFPRFKAMTPDTSQSPVYVFDTHLEAEAAIQDLARAGFDVKKLSLVGKGYHSEEHPVGFYSVGDRMKAWGGIGAFWGGIWGLMLAPAVFFLPGLGLMAMAGPLVAVLVSALDSAIVVGGMSALGAALVQVGVPHNHAIKYETALKADKYMLLVHGTTADKAQANLALAKAKAWETSMAEPLPAV